MARIFITGSADGLGQAAAKDLVAKGHEVVLHARNERRGEDAIKGVPGAADVLTADLSNIDETKELASKVNALGRFDAVIHNAGVYRVSGKEIFAVNTLAPYVLTCLIEPPDRLVYLSSGMHMQGRFALENFSSRCTTYSDSKLHVIMLSFAVARTWPDVFANAVDPGWVPTKMGGAGAPDNFAEGIETQVWLAISDDARAKVSGRYFHHMNVARHNAEADDIDSQEKFISLCEEITGVQLSGRDIN